jgi:mRNA interferase YafQ
MRQIDAQAAFKRDFKRELTSGKFGGLAKIVETTIEILANDLPLETRHHDHPLIGNWVGHRELHLKPNLLLIYRKVDTDVLQLSRLGSHSELFG